jgi:hypothetical protein
LGTTRSQAFAEQALWSVIGGFLSRMLSVGHRTCLLDTLARLEPAREILFFRAVPVHAT